MNSLLALMDNDFNKSGISSRRISLTSNETFMERRAKQIVANNGGKIPTLGRIKWGRAVCAWASFPGNFSFWMMPIGLVMQMPITPTLWAKGKLNDFHAWRMIR